MNWMHAVLLLILALIGSAAAFTGFRVFRMFQTHGDKTADELPREFRVWVHFFRMSMLLFLFAGIAAMMLW